MLCAYVDNTSVPIYPLLFLKTFDEMKYEVRFSRKRNANKQSEIYKKHGDTRKREIIDDPYDPGKNNTHLRDLKPRTTSLLYIIQPDLYEGIALHHPSSLSLSVALSPPLFRPKCLFSINNNRDCGYRRSMLIVLLFFFYCFE